MNDYFNFCGLLKNLLFFEQVNMRNMWYMPMILGIYIAIPFLAKIVKTYSLKTMLIPMSLVFIASTLLPSMNIIFHMFNMGMYKIILDLNFLGGIYGLYILAGYYIANKESGEYDNKILVVMFIVFFIITCMLQYWLYNNKIFYDVWYDFVTLFMCTICLFKLFVRIKNRKDSNIFTKITKYISKISLGIFFLHEIFLNILVKVTKKINLNNPLETLLLFLLSFILTVLFIIITSKIKLVKEKVYLIK